MQFSSRSGEGLGEGRNKERITQRPALRGARLIEFSSPPPPNSPPRSVPEGACPSEAAWVEGCGGSARGVGSGFGPDVGTGGPGGRSAAGEREPDARLPVRANPVGPGSAPVNTAHYSESRESRPLLRGNPRGPVLSMPSASALVPTVWAAPETAAHRHRPFPGDGGRWRHPEPRGGSGSSGRQLHNYLKIGGSPAASVLNI